METFEQVQIRHRKEQKDLQVRITQKKKNASKKTRKGVNTECDELERQLKERQEQELRSLDGVDESEDGVDEENNVPEGNEEQEIASKDVDNVVDDLAKTAISDHTPSEDGNQPRKRNRQKERLARRAAEQDAAVEAAKLEAANQPDQRAVELAKLQREFKSNGLQEKLIRPDGHCLFSAVADQLSQLGISIGKSEDGEEVKEDQRYKVVRKAAARYIQQHPDDFVAFLEEDLEQYVAKIRDTAEWGGEPELLALAKTYDVKICVIQDSGQQDFEPGSDTAEKLWLAYYKHGFGLGEHYNSLRKAP